MCLAAAGAFAAADQDRDGLDDQLEQRLLEQFVPQFETSRNECDIAPAEFVRDVEHPATQLRNGTIYGQAFPRQSRVELHYYHLWNRDCGRAGHALDAEHVSALLENAGGKWKALYWYAAAHEGTACDVSSGAKAGDVAGTDRGPQVWISEGKHASYLDPGACKWGCGGDKCSAAQPLKIARIVNLGEPGAALNGSRWIHSPRWPLAAKMKPDFTDTLVWLLEERKRGGVYTLNAYLRPTQGAMLGGDSTLDALDISGRKTGYALSTAGVATGRALDQSARNVGSALRMAALGTGRSLAFAQSTPAYDIVIRGGRVIDPDTGLDAVRHLGIRDGRIAVVSEKPLNGATVIAAEGLVVSPGFIDLHAHGQTNAANEYQAHDGVTTALELEVGVPSVEGYLKERTGKAILNFGASASHGAVRTLAMREFAADAATGQGSSIRWTELLMKGRYKELADAEEYTNLGALLERGMREGALGIGMAHQYYPGATREEIYRVFEMAARWRAPIFTHVRSMGIDAMQEVIANAAATGVSLHIVHVNSMSLGSLPVVLDLIGAARRRGLDITTEAYPYTAASTFIESTIFDGDWQKTLGISYGDLQWQNTGERLTKESFDRYRESGGVVIMHLMKPEWIRRAMASPFVLVASDGMPYAPGAHPRSAGTFSRVLGLYAREMKALPMKEALAKMTILPARRLEPVAPAMKNKGRLSVGADADITIFDAERVRDTATFEKGLSFSDGIIHVLVNGTAVVRDGKTVKDVFPGRAVTGTLGPG